MPRSSSRFTGSPAVVWSMAVFCLLLSCAAGPASAQDFSIYTRLYDLRPAPGSSESNRDDRGRLAGETFSIFHAGKVYDYLPQIDELTIFEPAHERFLIIINSRKIAATLAFNEIENVLFRAAKAAEHRLTAPDRPDEKMARATRFLLNPTFDQTFAARTNTLHLKSPYLSYQATCASAESPEHVDAYLQYANWTSRLNFVLHPKSLLPGPRIALNSVLQEKRLIPVEVELTSDVGSGLHLKAVHRYQWRLEAQDRRRIAYWDSLLTQPDLKRMKYEEFQRVLREQLRADVAKR